VTPNFIATLKATYLQAAIQINLASSKINPEYIQSCASELYKSEVACFADGKYVKIVVFWRESKNFNRCWKVRQNWGVFKGE